MKTIRWQNRGSGRVFISTAGLKEVVPEGANLFKAHMSVKRIPPDWLYFKGEKGFQIAPDGGRVLICKKGCGRQLISLKTLERKPG
jgi:hypothetical protein